MKNIILKSLFLLTCALGLYAMCNTSGLAAASAVCMFFTGFLTLRLAVFWE